MDQSNIKIEILNKVIGIMIKKKEKVKRNLIMEIYIYIMEILKNERKNQNNEIY